MSLAAALVKVMELAVAVARTAARAARVRSDGILFWLLSAIFIYLGWVRRVAVSSCWEGCGGSDAEELKKNKRRRVYI